MNVAVLGLGIIGSRAAARLQANPDHQVRVWNRSPKGFENEAASPLEATKDAELIALYLKDRGAVRDVVAKLSPNLPEGTWVLNHSTIDLETTRWLDDYGTTRGWRFIDAPFTGSRDAAANGKLVYYVGAPSEWIDVLRPLLLETGQKIIPCGPVGHATIIKLVTNLVSACTVQALAEGLATALRHGIEPQTFADAVASNACASVLSAMKLPTMAEADFTTHFSMENMLKDSRYARELAGDLETPAIDAVSERMARLCGEGMAQLDFSALAAPYLDS